MRYIVILIALISTITSCIETGYTFKDITSTKSRVLDDSRYIYTSEFTVGKGDIVINSEKFHFNDKLTKNGKRLFKVVNDTAYLVKSSPEEISYSSIIQSSDRITISHVVQNDESFIIPEGFEGYSSFNNSLVVIDNVAIRGTGGAWAWFLMMLCTLISISAVIFSIVVREDNFMLSILGYIVASVMIYFAYYLYSIH